MITDLTPLLPSGDLHRLDGLAVTADDSVWVSFQDTSLARIDLTTRSISANASGASLDRPDDVPKVDLPGWKPGDLCASPDRSMLAQLVVGKAVRRRQFHVGARPAGAQRHRRAGRLFTPVR